MRPEEYNGVVAKQARLDIDKKGHLTLTKSYCDAYVLGFHEGDCYLSTGQMIAEAIIGTTVLRGLYEPDVEFPTPKPSVPDDFESAWTAKKTSKSKRNVLDIKNKIQWYALEDSTDDDSDHETPEEGNGFIHFPNTPFDLSEFAKQLAIEIAVDFGIHVSLNIIEKQLEKYAIPAIQRIAANAAMKRAVVHGIVKRVSAQAVATAAAAGASKALKFGFGALKTSTTIFNVISFFLDVFDPYEYNKVLTKEQVSAIDRLIDLRYFGTDQLEEGTLLTPELIWDALKTKRQTEKETIYYAKRYQEYLDALTVSRHTSHAFLNVKLNLIPPGHTSRPQPKGWSDTQFYFILSSLVILIIGMWYVRFIDYFAWVVFGILLANISIM